MNMDSMYPNCTKKEFRREIVRMIEPLFESKKHYLGCHPFLKSTAAETEEHILRISADIDEYKLNIIELVLCLQNFGSSESEAFASFATDENPISSGCAPINKIQSFFARIRQKKPRNAYVGALPQSPNDTYSPILAPVDHTNLYQCHEIENDFLLILKAPNDAKTVSICRSETSENTGTVSDCNSDTVSIYGSETSENTGTVSDCDSDTVSNCGSNSTNNTGIISGRDLDTVSNCGSDSTNNTKIVSSCGSKTTNNSKRTQIRELLARPIARDISVYLSHLEHKLRRFPDPKKLCQLKRKIDDILFEAEMDQCETDTASSAITTQNMDNIWKTQAFRNEVVRKIELMMRRYDIHHIKTSKELENDEFLKSKNGNEYLENTTKLILQLLEIDSTLGCVNNLTEKVNATRVMIMELAQLGFVRPDLESLTI